MSDEPQESISNHKCFSVLYENGIQIYDVICLPEYVDKDTFTLYRSHWVLKAKQDSATNKHGKSISVVVNFCPFCGKRITPKKNPEGNKE